MDVLVAGGHGQVALHLLRLLAARGHHARGLIRNPDHAAELEQLGAVAVLCDLEHDDPRPHLGAAEAIVFAAGAGPGSGPERKRTVDYAGAVKLIEAAQELGCAATRSSPRWARGTRSPRPRRCAPTSRPSTTPTRRS